MNNDGENGIHHEERDEIGKEVVAALGEIQGYGSILTWTPNNNILDGTTKNAGIIVHSIDTHNHAGWYQHDDENVYNDLKDMGLHHLLEVLVVLDFRRSRAKVYAAQLPIAQHYEEAQNWDADQSNLVADTEFPNPFLDPHHPTPH